MFFILFPVGETMVFTVLFQVSVTTDSLSIYVPFGLGGFLLLVAIGIYIHEEYHKRKPAPSQKEVSVIKKKIQKEIKKPAVKKKAIKPPKKKIIKKKRTLVLSPTEKRLRELLRNAQFASRLSKTQAHKYYKEIYKVYQKLPTQKKKLYRKKVLAIHKKIST